MCVGFSAVSVCLCCTRWADSVFCVSVRLRGESPWSGIITRCGPTMSFGRSDSADLFMMGQPALLMVQYPINS